MLQQGGCTREIPFPKRKAMRYFLGTLTTHRRSHCMIVHLPYGTRRRGVSRCFTLFPRPLLLQCITNTSPTVVVDDMPATGKQRFFHLHVAAPLLCLCYGNPKPLYRVHLRRNTPPLQAEMWRAVPHPLFGWTWQHRERRTGMSCLLPYSHKRIYNPFPMFLPPVPLRYPVLRRPHLPFA